LLPPSSGLIALIALMMKAARTSETLVNFYQTTRRYNPEDSRLRTHRRENLKSYKNKEDFYCLVTSLQERIVHVNRVSSANTLKNKNGVMILW
jgi:hypothetical protein